MSLLDPSGGQSVGPALPSTLDTPNLRVMLNNSVQLPALSATVTNVTHFSTDTFEVECSLPDMPPGYGVPYWSDSTGDQVNVFMGLDNIAPVSFILGQVDVPQIKLNEQRLILKGRDLSAKLIDTKTTQKFQNQTSSDIAIMFAEEHGFVQNITTTTTKVGTYYAQDHVNLATAQSEWDVLTYLAQQEGFDLWVSGNTLNFVPLPVLDTAANYLVLYQDNQGGGAERYATYQRIELERSQTLAKDVTVIVRSWNQRQQAGFSVTYKRQQASKGQRSGGQGQIYSFAVPNLTKDQALNYAMRMADMITKRERIIEIDIPGDLTLNPRMALQLAGTNSSYDQKYYPDSVVREMDFRGFRMKCRAKNHSPQSTVIL